VANFVSEYRLQVSLRGEEWQEVANSRDRQPINDAHRRHRLWQRAATPEQQQQLDHLRARLAAVEQQRGHRPLRNWWVGNYGGGDGPFHVFLGGDPQRRGPEVTAASPAVLGGTLTGQGADVRADFGYELDPAAPEHERRLALARWITDPRNPLTTRVLANRLWHYHFGRGLVATPSDFGYMGSPPTHPRLLDYLARMLVRHGWRLKPLHRLIMSSQAYRQASTYDPAQARVDANTEYLWRFPPRRLTAEEIRDTMLFVTGNLERSMGGPGFRLYRYLQDNVATYVPLAEHGPDTYRRAVYHQGARAARVDLLSDFDCPDSALPAPRRSATTTPLQALAMLNHDFAHAMASRLAARLAATDRAGDSSPVDRGFLLALGREPDAAERLAATGLIREHGLRAFCRALFNCNEFLYVD
jgi:hypothetical protein